MPLAKVLATGAVVTALVAAVVFLAGGGSSLRMFRTAATPMNAAGPVADQVVYSARTANDAAIVLPGTVQARLVHAGQAHQIVALTRVGYTGEVSASHIDMTPRTGNSSRDPVLKVGSRAATAIDAKISDITAAVNTTAAGPGGRALYAGLTRIDFTSAPVVIISSGIDLANPDDLRSLNWTVPPAQVVAQVKKADDLAALHGPVTFVLVPTAGSQPQLGQAQQEYLESIWTALLKAAGATSVTFVGATGATATTAAPEAPTVQVPGAPPTPIPPAHLQNGTVTCTVPDSLFVYDTARLVDATTTRLDLAPCIGTALAAHATFALDGWASYEGPLNAQGKPSRNEPRNIQLSEERVKTIAELLVNDLNVPSSGITRMDGHGDLHQPDPDPASAANRVVVITYTVK